VAAQGVLGHGDSHPGPRDRRQYGYFHAGSRSTAEAAGKSREFGIRLAIGSQPCQLLARVIGEGMAITAFGTAAGLGCGLALHRVAGSYFEGVQLPGAPVVAGGAGGCESGAAGGAGATGGASPPVQPTEAYSPKPGGIGLIVISAPVIGMSGTCGASLIEHRVGTPRKVRTNPESGARLSPSIPNASGDEKLI